jgi:hypothetical protein
MVPAPQIRKKSPPQPKLQSKSATCSVTLFRSHACQPQNLRRTFRSPPSNQSKAQRRSAASLFQLYALGIRFCTGYIATMELFVRVYYRQLAWSI